MSESKKTPFYDKHVEFGAKIVDFAGYLMPVSYVGINAEHQAIRENVGVFDVSHMGEFFVEGDGAEAFLQMLTVNDVKSLVDGQAQYSAMCYEDGGIVDDLIVYRFHHKKYMMVVNASNIEKDFEWASRYVNKEMTLKNASSDYALLAIQGPKSRKILQTLTDVNLSDIEFYHFAEGKLAGIPMIISRTGYTGEIGFELYHKTDDALAVWDAVFTAGKEYGIQPVGLGARDTLRLEMKYCLYGNDIDASTNPIEAGLAWITKLDNDNFIAKDVLLNVKAQKHARKLIGFKMKEKGIPRHGFDVLVNGQKAGVVTSGTQSPTLKEAIGLAYVKHEFAKTGSEIFIDIRGKSFAAVIVKTPFVNSQPY